MTKDGVFHKSKPLIKEGKNVCSSARVCLVEGRIFLDNIEHQNMCYASIPRMDNEGGREVSVEVFGMLSEYGDIISYYVSKRF